MTSADYLRVCDICGHEWPRSRLKSIGQHKLACPDDFPGIHEIQALRLQSSERPFPPPVAPRRDAKESDPIELYRVAEAEVLNLIAVRDVTGIAPRRYVDVTVGDGAALGAATVPAAAWSVLYLYGVINEDRRPVQWITVGKAKMRSLADWLLTQQCGSPTEDSAITAVIGSTASTEVEYGGFVRQQAASPTTLLGEVYSEDVGAAGLALLRAYQTLGDATYRDGYRRALTCLRRMQEGGRLTRKYAAKDSSGTGRYQSGMWTHRLQINDTRALAGAVAPAAGLGGGAAVGLILKPWNTTRANVLTTGEIALTFSNWLVDFSLFPGTTVTFTVAGTFHNDNGISVIWRVRLGTANTTADTEIVRLTTAAVDTLTSASSVALAKPTDRRWVTLTAQRSANGSAVDTTVLGGLIQLVFS